MADFTAPFLTSRASSVLIVRGRQCFCPSSAATIWPAVSGPESQMTLITSHSASEIFGVLGIGVRLGSATSDYNCRRKFSDTCSHRQSQSQDLTDFCLCPLTPS